MPITRSNKSKYLYFYGVKNPIFNQFPELWKDNMKQLDNVLKQEEIPRFMVDQACGCEADSGDPDYTCDCEMQGACICSADCTCSCPTCKEAVSAMK